MQLSLATPHSSTADGECGGVFWEVLGGEGGDGVLSEFLSHLLHLL